MLLYCVCLLNFELQCAAVFGRKLYNLDKAYAHISLVDQCIQVWNRPTIYFFLYLQVSPDLWKIFSCEFLCLDQTLFPQNLPNHSGGSSGRPFRMPPSRYCLQLPLYLQVFPSIRYLLILKKCSILQVQHLSVSNRFLGHIQLLLCDITCYLLI